MIGKRIDQSRSAQCKRVLEHLLQVSETSSEENLGYLLALIQGGSR